MPSTASAAGATFIGCPEEVQPLLGYDFRDGPDGRGYYARDAPAPAAAPAADAPDVFAQRIAALSSKAAPPKGGGSADDFLADLKELGAM